VLAGEDGFEQGQVGVGDGVEAGDSTLVADRWSAQVVESFDGLAVIAGRLEGRQVSFVGSSALGQLGGSGRGWPLPCAWATRLNAGLLRALYANLE